MREVVRRMALSYGFCMTRTHRLACFWHNQFVLAYCQSNFPGIKSFRKWALLHALNWACHSQKSRFRDSVNKEFEQLCSFSYGNTINSNLTFTPSFTFAVGLLSIIATKIRRFLFKNKINFLFLGWILSFELTTVQRKTIDHLQVWGLKILQLKISVTKFFDVL